MSIPASQLSKIKGALLGVHAGDSLGASLEFMTHRDIVKRYPSPLRDIIGGGPFDWAAGAATDDTDLTRAVVLAYRDRAEHERAQRRRKTKGNAEFDVTRSAAEWSLKWYQGDWPGRKEGQKPKDIGGATLAGLSKYAKSRDPRNCGAGTGRAGNGSLMRCIPTALFAGTREARIKDSMEISAITHDDPRCTVSCAAYNEIVAALVRGDSPSQAMSGGIAVARDLDCPAVEEAIIDGTQLSISKIAREGPYNILPDETSGFVLQSLTVAIAALLDERSFEDVIVDVVRIGADTDTNGAISGGLLGARDGIEAIPRRWLDKLQFGWAFEEAVRNIHHL